MITVITGTPGAGKTLYAITKLLRPLLGATVEVKTDDGATVTVPRTIYTNIKGLLIEHELVQADTDQGLHNWHKWAKPGAVIVIDEFQHIWPPRPNGSKVPDDIAALDTHRHMGVDFILITQNLMNVDRHIHGLTGRHLHVRRMGNLGLTIVYEWDHASRTLMFSKAITKSPWKYDKSVFQLYKSAEVHTKQPRKIPPLAFVIVFAICAAAYQIPSAWSRIVGKSELIAAKKQTSDQAPAAPPAPDKAPRQAMPATAPASAASSAAPVQFSGCASAKGVCRCYDGHGKRVDKPSDFCEAETSPGPVQLANILPTKNEHGRRVDPNAASDVDVIEWMAKRSAMPRY